MERSVIIIDRVNKLLEDMTMKTREYYEAELAKAEERIESLLRVERRLIAERGRGFRHPFYHKRIIQLDDRIFNLRAKLDSMV